MSQPTLGIGCDENLKYSGAQDAESAAYLNTGTCTYTLQTQATPPVVLDSGTLSYVAASNGEYLGIIDAAVTALLTAGAFYDIIITFSQGNYNDKRKIAYMAQNRRST